MCKWGLGSEPVASGEVIACRRPIAVSVGWEEDGEERVGERSADLCFFLWGGGPEPSWSDTGTIKEKIEVNTNAVLSFVTIYDNYNISTFSPL